MDETNTMLLHGKPVTREAMLAFKKAYMKALCQRQYLFIFDGQEVLVRYAKYVVEYAETQLGVLKDTPRNVDQKGLS